MPLEMLGSVGDGLRLGVVLVTTLVLAYWTYQRTIAGSGEDPNISLATGDRKGYLSFVMSGVVAVAVVAGGWVWGLWPQVQEQPALLAIPAAFLVAHIWFEWRETA